MRLKRNICLILFLSCLMGGFSGISVSARDEIQEGLPVIIRWETGNGYDGNGSRIMGGWAYDTVNEAGRYVLFDENGMVLKKAESWETRDDTGEYFTPTEQKSGIIALRSELFEGFDGKISVTIESESSGLKKYVLSSENLYECNVSATSGVYRIQKAEAEDLQAVYATEYRKEPFRMEEKGLLLFHIKVTDEKIGEVQSDGKAGMPADAQEEAAPDGKDSRKRASEKSIGERDFMYEGSIEHRYMNRKTLLIGAGLVAILTAGLLIRSRKNKYH